PGHRLADHVGQVHVGSHAGRHVEGRGRLGMPGLPECGTCLGVEPGMPVHRTRTSGLPRPRTPVGTTRMPGLPRPRTPVGTTRMPGLPRPRTPVGTTRTSRFPEALAWVARRGGAWIRGRARWELARA